MIESLRPYSNTLPSDHDWFPTLPSHWVARRAKYSYREVDERSTGGDEELLSVSHKTGVTPRSQKNITMFMAETYEGHKTCQPGDIVVNTMWAWMAALGVSKHAGIISPAYGVYRQRRDGDFDPRYLDYLLRTEAYRGEYLRSSRGITTSRLRLYPDDFLQIPFVQPPLDEQQLIVRFLDWHGAMSGRLIRAKKRLIALLNEQKQSIIHRAVTRGLDLDARKKPSGVDWLGDVPEGWEVKRLKRACRVGAGKGTIKGIDPDALVSFLPMERVGADGSADYSQMMPLREIGSGFSVFRRDDVIVAKITPCFENGKGALLSSMPTEIGFGSSEFIVLRALAGLRPEFLYLLTSEGQFRRSGVEAMTGSAGQQRVSPEFIGNYVVALPPEETQVEICKFVNRECAEFEEAVGTIKDEISLIQEFRTRLIADVVTGQLDVRAVAATLPDPSEEMVVDEPLDDADPDEIGDAADDEEAAAA